MSHQTISEFQMHQSSKYERRDLAILEETLTNIFRTSVWRKGLLNKMHKVQTIKEKIVEFDCVKI